MSLPRHAWLRAVVVLYVPQLVPLGVTDLAGHAHCLEIYGSMFPILPGFLVAMLGRRWFGIEIDESGGFVVMALVTAVLIASLAWGFRRGGVVAGRVLAVVAALLSTFHALGVVAAIRS